MPQPISISILIFFIFLALQGFAQNSGNEYYSIADKQWKKGDFEKAIEFYSLGINANDNSKGRNFYGRAYCYWKLQEFELAKNDANSILETESQNPRWLNSYTYELKALIAYVQDDLDLELIFWQEALIYKPSDIKLMNAVGITLIEQGRNIEGIEMLNQVIEIDTTYSFAFVNRAFGLIKIGADQSAIPNLKRSYELDSENPFLYRVLFNYYNSLGSDHIACALLEIALRKDMVGYGNFKDIEKLEELFVSHCTTTR